MPLLPGLCAEANATTYAVSLAACAAGGAPLQAWTLDASSGELSVAGLPGFCLASSQAPAVPYVQVWRGWEEGGG